MSGRGFQIGGRAAELRWAFDRSFAEAPAEGAPVEDFLGIRIGPDPFAVRLAEIAGLFADRTATSLPSSITELLGIAGFRGSIVAVYDLRALLGYPVSEKPRWLIVAAEMPVGLAFDAFDGHLRIPRKGGASAELTDNARPYIREVLSLGNVIRPVMRVATILEAVRRRAEVGVPIQEE